jgi:tRNA-binding EMAP/Myf-like protein
VSSKRRAQSAKRKTAGQRRAGALVLRLALKRSNVLKALAPRQIRAVLQSGGMNLCAENGHDLGADGRWRDLGELSIPAGDEAALTTITGAASAVLERGGRRR